MRQIRASREIYIKEHFGENWRGYQVSFPFGGKHVSRLFSISKYGRKALLAAVAWRDAEFQRLYGRPFWGTLKFVHHVAHERSSTGFVGVHLRRKTVRQKYKKRFYIYRRELVEAQHPTGKRRREFGVRRYGLRQALRLAIAQRAAWVQEHLGQWPLSGRGLAALKMA